jgi:hypothetical protein
MVDHETHAGFVEQPFPFVNKGLKNGKPDLNDRKNSPALVKFTPLNHAH